MKMGLVALMVLGLAAAGVAGFAVANKNEGKAEGRVFELRTYYAAPGKMEALHARFRDHTLKFFEKHGMTVEGFWKPLDEKAQAEKLVYLLSFPSKEAADQSWKEFREDPDWKAAREASEKKGGGSLTEPKGGVVSEFLKPTDYSPLK